MSGRHDLSHEEAAHAVAALREFVAVAGSQSEAARRLGVTPAAVCDVLGGRRRAGFRLVRALREAHPGASASVDAIAEESFIATDPVVRACRVALAQAEQAARERFRGGARS